MNYCFLIYHLFKIFLRSINFEVNFMNSSMLNVKLIQLILVPIIQQSSSIFYFKAFSSLSISKLEHRTAKLPAVVTDDYRNFNSLISLIRIRKLSPTKSPKVKNRSTNGIFILSSSSINSKTKYKKLSPLDDR